MRYSVIVGNIGTVYDGEDKKEAMGHFDTYVAQSKAGIGRAGGEDVTLMEDGEPVKEFDGGELDQPGCAGGESAGYDL